jgi:hypothetical protein
LNGLKSFDERIYSNVMLEPVVGKTKRHEVRLLVTASGADSGNVRWLSRSDLLSAKF